MTAFFRIGGARRASVLAMLLAIVLLVCGLFGLGCLSGCGVSDPNEPPPESPANVSGKLVVRFIDVGQGDAALISCDGHHMLIDGGPRDAAQKTYAILANLSITRLDAIIASHSDADHISGISSALNYASAAVCYCNVETDDTRTFQNMLRYLEKGGCPLVIPTPGDTFALGEATVTFVGPVRQFDDENSNSLVCRIDYGSTSFLFTGDATREAETAMMEEAARLRADVLKVAHHGSGSSSSKTFLEAVSPRYAVISVGADNPWDHPHDSVLQRLNAVGATVLRTDESGSIIITSDGRDLTVETVDMIEK